ncbi:putative cyclic diguanylate phosphodiesterase (EAL) domain protein [Escherichia coli H605]|uniref:cyclic-guanylate-specific phosphodiesterase n=2 Tax=Escherichia TaxID=561 RepID=A0AAJ3P245_ECOLX|nr:MULTISPECIES: cyclic diguanylate phosphodiesterase [Escherichia]OSL50139.1 putative cyclic diguanylate phosphodiesterase (EAL) domain protein [Escherichia coli H605]EFB3348529.1 EAL domain-containing protein [Escherichia coli]EFD1056112.1 EAL domain-containing protein [Escherichia coli]EJH3422698.1 EAL domain-containing protein [Escherichia coli]MDR4876899.1 cyclic diguanylate phosphodiesterase [Escherichia ruysiae]
MQKAQRIIKTYRRNRMIVCTICALFTLVATLSVRFISQRNLNQQRVILFANHAVEELDKVLQPLQEGRELLLPLIGLPCSVAHLPLRKQAAKLQTVRSIGLVQNGTLYCSSIFGYRNVPVYDIQTDLPAPRPLLRLSTDRVLIKGSPVLIQWYPLSSHSGDGVLEMINIGLLTTMLLEPQLPQIRNASLTVADRHLLYDDGLVDSLPPLNGNERYQVSSQNFPFTISVSGPGATQLALHHLPSQLPLAVLLSLLVGYVAWLATAHRMSFSREINLGLAQHEFELFCQPLLNARSQQCIGVEILLRWNNPRQGWISPDVFIPIAEEHHLIVPLTRYVMMETIRQIHVFPISNQFHIGINVAPSHFRRGVLLKDLNQYWFSAHPIQQLILEITERDALLDVDYRIARELHRKNVKLAIDDFGTGNSSFSWLETLRPDVLKIDKSFTAAIGSDAVNSTITDIIIALGQRLNIELVAEGVETQEQAKYLRRHGVHILQGYLYAQPMPLRDFPKWLAGSQPPPARHNGHITPVMPFR